MAYQFPSELDRFVKDELARGHYDSEDELVTDAVRLLQREREEAVAGIREGLEDMKAGRGQPLHEVDAELRRKHNIPRDA